MRTSLLPRGGRCLATKFSHTTWRGLITLTLLHELSGDRRRGAEKAFSNLGAGLEEIRTQLSLSDSSRILVEFDEESHVFSFAAVREWSQQFVVQVGLSLGALKGEKSCRRPRSIDPNDYRLSV